MQAFIVNQILKRIGNKMGKSMFNDTLNPDEAYADRISSDFGITWHDAYDAYHQSPKFWEESYERDPNDRRNVPAMAPVKRTSQLLAAIPPPTDGGSPSGKRDGFWSDLFPDRASLKEMERQWRD
jgi:hypothetical protein